MLLNRAGGVMVDSVSLADGRNLRNVLDRRECSVNVEVFDVAEMTADAQVMHQELAVDLPKYSVVRTEEIVALSRDHRNLLKSVLQLLP